MEVIVCKIEEYCSYGNFDNLKNNKRKLSNKPTKQEIIIIDIRGRYIGKIIIQGLNFWRMNLKAFKSKLLYPK